MRAKNLYNDNSTDEKLTLKGRLRLWKADNLSRKMKFDSFEDLKKYLKGDEE